MKNNHLVPFDTTLGEQICSLYAQINLATYALLKLIHAFDENRGYAREGCKTTAQWLTYRCGIGPAAAREKVRVGRALHELDVIPAAFAEGRISYSKVRAMTRVATVDNEQRLLNIALHANAAQTETVMRQYRQTLTVKQVQEDASTLSYSRDSAGGLVFKGRLSAEHGMLLLQALEAVEPPAEVSGHQRNAECLMGVVEQALAAKQANGRVSSADRFQIHIDLDSSPLAEPLKERLLCDASVVTHRCDEQGTPLPASKTRLVSGPLRRALHKRDGGCRFPGCDHNRFVDAHHVHHWSKGGKTELNNLVLLCRFHHRLIHEQGYRVHRELVDDGSVDFVFRDPEGNVLPAVADQLTGPVVPEPIPSSASAMNELENVSAETFFPYETFDAQAIDPYTLTPELGHKPPDYHYINFVLMQHEDP